ncbi:MAG: prephenate dehydrogenase [Candidatus Omnitrophica bacterium]|nr:prephenate dehydrogenase [Candidatus Omnitrophota bacterium]
MNFNKVTVIGAGFMGGCFAINLKKKKIAKSIWAVARNQQRVRQINKLNIFDKVITNLESAVDNAEVVVLATPVSAIITYIEKIAPLVHKKCVVFDLGSTKREIIKKAKEFLKDNFVGCHPLCGSEKKGAAFAVDSLFEDSLCILTPLMKNRAFAITNKLFKSLGARTITLDANRHDKILGFVSALPHLLSFSLIKALPSEFSPFAAGSFKDLTRISASDSLLWADIFLSNSGNLKDAAANLNRSIKTFLRIIEKNDRAKLISLLRAVNQKHKRLIE